jgi:hypothetical protein
MKFLSLDGSQTRTFQVVAFLLHTADPEQTVWYENMTSDNSLKYNGTDFHISERLNYKRRNS